MIHQHLITTKAPSTDKSAAPSTDDTPTSDDTKAPSTDKSAAPSTDDTPTSYDTKALLTNPQHRQQMIHQDI